MPVRLHDCMLRAETALILPRQTQDSGEKALQQQSEFCVEQGDRLDTDIAFGQAGGVSTLLVLSGVTTEAALLSAENSIHPDYYTDALPDLLEHT